MSQIQELPLELIRLSPYNTRGDILDEDLESLVQSIRETGLVEPLKVRTLKDEIHFAYELVSGERRLRALKILGVEYARCIVKDMTDMEVILEQWAENEERKDLSDYGKAKKLKQLLEATKLNQADLSAKLGKTQPWVSNHLRLLSLEKFISREIIQQLSEKQARAILSAPDEDIPVVCAAIERDYEEKKTLPSASDIADFIKDMQRDKEVLPETGPAQRSAQGSPLSEPGQQEKQPPDHEHVYDAGSTHCRICGRELTALKSVAAGIGPVCASGKPRSSPETLEDEFNGIAGRLGIGPSPGDISSKSKIDTSEEPRYTPSEEEIFAFLNRFKYEKNIDGILLDNMISLFGLSASQALNWLEKWRDARAKSPKLTPEEKALLEDYERTHPKEDDPLKKLFKYYPAEIMDTVLSRVHSDNFETILKYCRRYIEELHIRAPDELRKTSLEAIRW
jgi:ParB family chromosome partitioning protein